MEKVPDLLGGDSPSAVKVVHPQVAINDGSRQQSDVLGIFHYLRPVYQQPLEAMI